MVKEWDDSDVEWHENVFDKAQEHIDAGKQFGIDFDKE